MSRHQGLSPQLVQAIDVEHNYIPYCFKHTFALLWRREFTAEYSKAQP